MKKYSITIFFPCYNEEQNVERVTREALEVAGRLFDDFEIIIVNDGSKDRTAEIADRLSKENPFIRAIHHEHNRVTGQRFGQDLKMQQKSWFFILTGTDNSKLKR